MICAKNVDADSAAVTCISVVTRTIMVMIIITLKTKSITTITGIRTGH